jgi:hypothetical protein
MGANVLVGVTASQGANELVGVTATQGANKLVGVTATQGKGNNSQTTASAMNMKQRRRETRKSNKAKRQIKQLSQSLDETYWNTHQVESTIKPEKDPVYPQYRGEMRPSGEALNHPAAEMLLQYAQKGCPAVTGTDWTLDQLEAAVQRGPHRSALQPAAIAQHAKELDEKIAKGQARVFKWSELKKNLPPKLKISLLAMRPHKSRPF